MSPSQYKRIVLKERPGFGNAVDPAKTFKTETVPYDFKPTDSQVVVQVAWISLDPAMRGWLNDARSYLPPVQIGEVMRAGCIATVVEAGKSSGLAVGDLVYGTFGWTEYTVAEGRKVDKITLPPGAQPVDFLNTLGMPGMTAYFGLRDVGALKPGESLLVSGAAGAVGSLVCQLGVKTGAKVFALAGSDDKVQWLEKDIGVTKALNYKSPTFKEDFRKLGLIDVYFDNVGGEILDMTLARLKQNARVVFCGAISGYNSPPAPLTNYQMLISMRAKIEGFIVFDYAKQYPVAIKELAESLSDGSIKRKFHVVEGLEQAPSALPLLFTGGNTGKLVVKLPVAAKL